MKPKGSIKQSVVRFIRSEAEHDYPNDTQLLTHLNSRTKSKDSSIPALRMALKHMLELYPHDKLTRVLLGEFKRTNTPINPQRAGINTNPLTWDSPEIQESLEHA